MLRSHTLPSLHPLRSRNVLIMTGFLSSMYYLIQVFLFHRILITQTLTDTYPLTYKVTLFIDLVRGYLTMFPLMHVSFILLSTVLVGLNLTLLIALIQRVKQSGKVKMSFGGMGVFALISTGCPSCGLTVLSFLGPSSGILAGVFHNPLAQTTMILLLGSSIFYSLRQLEKGLSCRI